MASPRALTTGSWVQRDWLEKTPGRAAWLHSNPVPMHMHTVFAKQTQVLCGDFYLWEPAISTPSRPPTVRCKAAMMPFSETSRHYRWCSGQRTADSLKHRSVFSRMESVNLDIDLDMKLGFIPFQMAFWGGDYNINSTASEERIPEGRITTGSGVTLDSHVSNFLIQKLDLSN